MCHNDQAKSCRFGKDAQVSDIIETGILEKRMQLDPCKPDPFNAAQLRFIIRKIRVHTSKGKDPVFVKLFIDEGVKFTN